ncbi:hypothetical protein BDV27DRAFT_51887 [Aspergillus caelatus]|uniref:Uncharacterized protein n=1 Tax=Aspergillus caelatus TaxID=61420 RepID=A0A5N7AGP5_9EURO|nr:uncharacterized protein BDV27DRAFT_51887 [Aspergillus caelatus]KAE8368249.1 hypothetical protein BDV27DRAFT_51887 [Aspergillus caelatus]
MPNNFGGSISHIGMSPAATMLASSSVMIHRSLFATGLSRVTVSDHLRLFPTDLASSTPLDFNHLIQEPGRKLPSNGIRNHLRTESEISSGEGKERKPWGCLVGYARHRSYTRIACLLRDHVFCCRQGTSASELNHLMDMDSSLGYGRILIKTSHIIVIGAAISWHPKASQT